MDIKNSNPLGIIGLIGAIILVVGVFLNWLTLDAWILGTTTWTGLDVLQGAHNLGDTDIKYTFVPLVALICGIIALVIMLVPTLKNDEKFQNINNILGILTLVLAIVVVIFGILFYTQEDLTKVFSIGIGFWLVIIGGIITMIGGLMPIVKNKLLK